MSAPLLTLLTAFLAALTVLGALDAVWRQPPGRVLWTAAAFSGFAALVALVFLLLNEAPVMQALPLGLPGAGFRLTLDPLAALFTVMLFGAGAAICAVAAAEPAPAQTDAPIPLALAAFGLTILGGDSFARGAGLALAGGAIWLLRPTDRAGAAQLAVALLAAATVVAAADAPQPTLLWLALLGPGALAGLAPLHAWLAPAHDSASRAAALLAGGAAPVATYLILRLLFLQPEAVPPAWWGLPFAFLGIVSILAGGLEAVRQPDLDTAVAANTVRQTGLIAIGLGIALTARAADLAGATAMALAVVLLLAILQAVCGTLLALAAGAIGRGAGTRGFDRLGGVIHRMPVTTGCLLAGLFGLTALPPSGGFAAIWLLFHAVLGLPHAGTLPFRLLLCALVAALGAAAGLGTAGMLRLIGVVCLGRPRTPRAAVAEELRRPARITLALLAVTAAGWGVLAGPLLHLLVNAPIRTLTGTGTLTGTRLGASAGWLGLAPGAEASGYAALPLAALLLLVAGAALWVRRGRAALWVRRGRTVLVAQSDTMVGPAWNDGFAAPPAWLPFGDPATQSTGTGFAPVPPWLPSDPRRLLRLPVMPPLRLTMPRLRAPAVALILVAALLAFCAWTGAT